MLNRDKPKKVKYWSDYEDGRLIWECFECPSCEYEFNENDIKRKINYCPECGQALRWLIEEPEREYEYDPNDRESAS